MGLNALREPARGQTLRPVLRVRRGQRHPGGDLSARSARTWFTARPAAAASLEAARIARVEVPFPPGTPDRRSRV